MPTYEYECNECGERFEEFCRVSDDKKSENKITCPNCGADKVIRVYSTFGTASPSCGAMEEKHHFG